jgi:hypothetical protein
LIERAGGEDIFPEMKSRRIARERTSCQNKFAGRTPKSFLPRGAANRLNARKSLHAAVGRKRPPSGQAKFTKYREKIFYSPVFDWFMVSSE